VIFEWDESKRQRNIELHGIDFERAKEIWQGPVLEIPSSQTQHGEAREPETDYFCESSEAL
jgi:uncharacterized protein